MSGLCLAEYQAGAWHWSSRRSRLDLHQISSAERRQITSAKAGERRARERHRASQITAAVSRCGAGTFGCATAGAHLQRFPAGTMLLLEGDPVDFLYVLLDGQVELHGTWNDHETVLTILRPVSTFILAAVVLDADALMSARTLERCEILMIPGDAIRTAMRLDTRFAMAVSRDLAGCYRGMVRNIKNHKLRNGVERLANYLLALRAADNSGGVVRLHHEKRVLASLLGMTPENLSRAFAALQQHGVAVQGAIVTLASVGRAREPGKARSSHRQSCAPRRRNRRRRRR